MSRFEGDSILQGLIERQSYAEAEAYCAGRSGDGWHLLQAAVCFLNDTDGDAYDVRGPLILDRYVTDHPADNDARFLRAYWSTISTEWTEQMDLELVAVSNGLEPHPYASLCLAGFRAYPASRYYLRRVLKVQPHNLRAKVQLAREEVRWGSRAQGIEQLRAALSVEPFVEDSWGILNGYANEVWTGAAHADQIRQQAEAELGRIG